MNYFSNREALQAMLECLSLSETQQVEAQPSWLDWWRATRKKAQEVFRGIPEERQKAERALQALRGQTGADTLLRWLRE